MATPARPAQFVAFLFDLLTMSIIVVVRRVPFLSRRAVVVLVLILLAFS